MRVVGDHAGKRKRTNLVRVVGDHAGKRKRTNLLKVVGDHAGKEEEGEPCESGRRSR